MWARPRFDLETDAWVVEHEGNAVGYAQVWAEDEAHVSGFALVHPEHTGRGLGSALAGLIEGRSAELAAGDARLHSATIPEDVDAARLLTARGYAWARRFWHLQIEFDGPQEEAVAPHGITLRIPRSRTAILGPPTRRPRGGVRGPLGLRPDPIRGVPRPECPPGGLRPGPVDRRRRRGFARSASWPARPTAIAGRSTFSASCGPIEVGGSPQRCSGAASRRSHPGDWRGCGSTWTRTTRRGRWRSTSAWACVPSPRTTCGRGPSKDGRPERSGPEHGHHPPGLRATSGRGLMPRQCPPTRRSTPGSPRASTRSNP